MTTDPAEQIAFEAKLLPAGEQASFVARTCGLDTALRARVEATMNRARARADTIDDPNVGRSIGPYVIERRLAAGGMGTVYVAVRREDVEVRVALKLIKRGMDTDEIVRRFERERQFLAALDHPNIARLRDAGTTDDGLPYFVMDYVEGVPVDAFCEQHQLGVTERLVLMRTICRTVHYAHQNTIVHRDLHPGNILVTESGTPKLIDFGIAKLTNQAVGFHEIGVTRTEQRILTPEYASPEQVRGDPTNTTSDVYSLGVLMYRLLTGRAPYELTSRGRGELERVICETMPRPPSQVVAASGRLRRRLAGDLDHIVLMAMRKERGRRYQSAEQMAEDLERFLQRRPVIARGDSVGYRTAKFLRRNRGAVAAGSFLAMLLVAWTVHATTQARRNATLAEDNAALAAGERAAAGVATAAKREAEAARDAARREAGRSVRARERGDVLRADSLVAQATAQTESGRWRAAKARLGDALELYDRYDQPPLKVDLAQLRVFAKAPEPLAEHPFDFATVCISADGDLAMGTQRATVHLWETPTGRPRFRFDGHRGAAYGLGFSSDGRVAITSGAETVRLWSTESGALLRTIDAGLEIRGARIEAAAGRIWVHTKDGRVRRFDGATGLPLAEHVITESIGTRLRAVSPDGTLLAFSSSRSDEFVVADLRSAMMRIWQHRRKSVQSMAFSPDGRSLVTGQRSGRLSSWDTTTWRREDIENLHRGIIYDIAFLPGGHEFVSAAQTELAVLWSDRGGAWAPVRHFTGHQHSLRSIAISADGEIMISCGYDGGTKVWPLVAASGVTRFDADALSRDGRLARDSDGVVDVATGMALGRDPDGLLDRAFDGDGRVAVRAADGTVVLEDQPTGRTITRLESDTDGRTVGVITPDCRAVVVFATDGRGEVLALDGGTPPGPFSLPVGGRGFPGLAMSTDGGRFIAYHSINRDPKLIDITRRQDIVTFPGHTRGMSGAVPAANARLVLTSGWNGSVRLWDTRTVRELMRIEGPRRARNATMTPAATHLITGEPGGEERWDLRWPGRFRALRDALPRAFVRGDDAGWSADDLATLGAWYAHRGVWRWARRLLESAREQGSDVDPLVLARSAVHLGDTAGAHAYYNAAFRRGEAPREYLLLCLAATAPTPDATVGGRASMSLARDAMPQPLGREELTELAVMHARFRHWSDALELLDSAHRRGASGPALVRAQCLLGLERDEAARPWLERARGEQPIDAGYAELWLRSLAPDPAPAGEEPSETRITEMDARDTDALRRSVGRRIRVTGRLASALWDFAEESLEVRLAGSELRATVFARSRYRFEDGLAEHVLERLAGASVVLTGNLGWGAGGPEIIVDFPDQLRVADRLLVGAIPFDAAIEHMGRNVTIEGRVLEAELRSTVWVLHFSTDRFGAFTVPIFRPAWSVWQDAPDRLFSGALVRVSGSVTLYNGAPQVGVHDAAQIEIVGHGPIARRPAEEALADAPRVEPGAPTRAEVPIDAPIVPWDRAHEHVGRTISAEGVIVMTRNIGSICFLNFDRDYVGKFYIAVFPEAFGAWGGAPEAALEGKRVRVTGEIELHRGRPQIAVRDARQIVVVADPGD